jgi:hypothetical protein
VSETNRYVGQNVIVTNQSGERVDGEVVSISKDMVGVRLRTGEVLSVNKESVENE